MLAPRVNAFTAAQPIRAQSGNVIMLIAALTSGILLAFLFFALNFVQMLGANHQQRSSIEAAALAVASDLSRIVIEDDNFGFVGLSDSAPVGEATLAQDGYFLQVRSINQLMGTIRLDMIIADAIGDPTMMKFAQYDYTKVRRTATNLQAALTQALLPGGQFTDISGRAVTPYEDAIAAYKSNEIRMAGASQYVAGSMKLSLGSLEGGEPTNTPIPQPETYANVQSDQSYEGLYNSYINIPYANADFVFAGVGDEVKLVDSSKFLATNSSLPYTISTIVRAEADQKFFQGPNMAGKILHSVACAQPASTADPLPAPGKLVISFTDQSTANLTKPADLLLNQQLSKQHANLVTPVGGDYPGTGALFRPNWPLGGVPSISSVFSAGIYKWVSRDCTKANVLAVKSMMEQPFLPGGQMQVYEFLADGTVLQTLHQESKGLVFQESENQLYGQAPYSTIAPKGEAANYIAQAQIWVFQPGRIRGGRHAGEPLPDSTLDTTVLARREITGDTVGCLPGEMDKKIVQGLEFGSGGFGGGTYAATGIGFDAGAATVNTPVIISFPIGQRQVRPTYQHNGLTVQFTFDLLPN